MKKYSIKEICVVAAIFLGIVFGFIIITGIFDSSYHLVDDHEFVRILTDIENNGFIQTLSKWTLDSFTIRFRPLYFVIRVVLTSIFGLNFKLWYSWKALELVITMFFLYFSARNFKCNKIISFLFPLLIFVGEQTRIWYRLGPQEVTGMLFLSIALFFMTEYCLYKNKKIYIFIILASLLLMSLMKESFVLMLPPMILLKLILDYYNSKDSLKEIIKKNILFITIFTLIFLAEIFVIIFCVGTSKIDYAGFSSDTSIYQYINGIKNSFFSQGIIEPMLLLMMAIGVIISSNKYKNEKKEKILLYTTLCFVIFIIISQFILHAKSGMYERYIVPMSFAYSFMIVILAPKFIENKKYIYIYFFIVLIILYKLLFLTLSPALEYKKDGININSCLNYVKENCNNEQCILVIMDSENRFSTAHYLKYYGFDNVIRYMGDNKYALTENDTLYPMEDIKEKVDIIISNYVNKLKNDNQILNSFEEINFNDYILYIRK